MQFVLCKGLWPASCEAFSCLVLFNVVVEFDIVITSMGKRGLVALHLVFCYTVEPQ